MSETSDSSTENALPKPEELLANIDATIRPSESKSIEEDFKRKFQKNAIRSELDYAHAQGVREHYTHKRYWSCFLMAAIGGMILFQSILLTLVGLGIFDYSQYKWLLPALLAQNLGQVVGLAVWAVKHLFSDIRTAGTKAKSDGIRKKS